MTLSVDEGVSLSDMIMGKDVEETDMKKEDVKDPCDIWSELQNNHFKADLTDIWEALEKLMKKNFTLLMRLSLNEKDIKSQVHKCLKFALTQHFNSEKNEISLTEFIFSKLNLALEIFTFLRSST